MTRYGYLPEKHWASTSYYRDHAPQWCDGRYIWLFDYGGKLERFDTETLVLELMNDRPAYIYSSGEPSVDSHSLSLASIAYRAMSRVTGDDDFLYWIEPHQPYKESDGTRHSDSYLGVLRRMSLEEPYYVERVDNGWDAPDGYTPGLTTSPFDNLETTVYINGDSGIPYFESTVALWNEYLLFNKVVLNSAQYVSHQICAWPLAGGDIRVLYEIPREGMTSANSDVAEVRGPSWNYDYFHGFGGPDLEGMLLKETKFTVVNDYLVFANAATGFSWPSGPQNANHVAFNLPALFEASEAGPVLHDRTNPWYTMIHNGTGNWEQSSDWNFEVDDRFYGMRDGENPLVYWNAIYSGTAGRGDLSGSLVFASALYFESLQWYWNNTFIHKLSPPETGPAEPVWDITLSFEGKTLEGYGRQSILHGKEAPKEVVLE